MLVADSGVKLQSFANAVKEAGERRSLRINTLETEVMVVTRMKEVPRDSCRGRSTASTWRLNVRGREVRVGKLREASQLLRGRLEE